MSVYGFQFKDGPSVPFAQLVYVGHETRRKAYGWSGLERLNDNQCIFQYTLSGRGSLRDGARTYSLEPGYAFLVRTGTDHRYYLPEDSDHWTFIYITLIGSEALACWSLIHNQSGPVVRLDQESPVIRLLDNIYGEAGRKAIANGYKSAGLATLFLMELYQAFKYKPTLPAAWPEAIVQAVQMIKENYASIDSIQQMGRALGLNEYVFSRMFHKATGMTAMHYLTKVRIEKAMELLRQTELNLDEIAKRTGYSCDNYFNKVFRKRTGLSPGQFRSGDKISPMLDHIYFD